MVESTSVSTAPNASATSTLNESAQTEDRACQRSPRGAVKRVVEMTVDKLGKSLAPKASHSPSPPTSPSRRVFSLSRKSKAKEKATSGDDTDGNLSASTPSHSRHRPRLSLRSAHHVMSTNDDSPFIRPPSPSLPTGGLSSQSFRGDGSMRVGTQTLIQALQAIPWDDDSDKYDDKVNHDLSSAESESEEEYNSAGKLASSIHTIHRPLARSRRSDALSSHPVHGVRASAIKKSAYSLPGVEEREDEPPTSDDDIEADDFEATPRNSPALPSGVQNAGGATNQVASSQSRRLPQRTSSIVTVRQQRRARLAEKLREVFDLEGIEEVWAEMPCWLLRSILLQGYMYLTNSYLCFFAHMPTKEDQILKSGSLNKKAARTKRWIKHWFILKNDVLSWYNSSHDPYFPHGIVDLRYAISCEPVDETGLRLRTNQKTVSLSADSVPSRDEWVKAVRKVMFKAQNLGASVKIAIPYSAILDVEKSSAMDFSETIEVKVFEKEEHFSLDSYFFAYFSDLSGALEQIRDAVRAYRAAPQGVSSPAVLDTTHIRVSSQPGYGVIDRTHSLPAPDSTSKFSAVSGFNLTSLLKPFQDTHAAATAQKTENVSAPQRDSEDFTHITARASFVPITSSGSPSLLASSPSPRVQQQPLPPLPPSKISESSIAMSTSTSISEHTYPPSPRDAPGVMPSESNSGSYWSVSVPSWLKGSSKKFFSSPFGTGVSAPAVSEVYNSLPTMQSELGHSILDTPDFKFDPDVVEEFRGSFAFDEREILLGYFTGYIYRLLPVYGRLYISANFFCFKSSGPLTMKTRMVLPIRDVMATEVSKATRFTHHGLTVIVKGHEELFFEFSAEARRSAFVRLLDRQMEDVRERIVVGENNKAPSASRRDALILEEFSSAYPHNSESEPTLDRTTDSLPAIMFTSGSSTFLTFKPKESMRFTILTIGSRGDVQPYIALAKGLMADGHRVKIATHAEFKGWIESHGIEHGYVGGDPTELMRICIENGTFTVSFLKEGLQKFRGWIDDLLKTAWEACQGTDILIETPGAMAGYHIAEALSIPYFRAFTMTWTRTRAYPHAFAVPERKMGGSYNYMTYVIFDQVFWRGISGQVNRFRKNVLHLGSTSLDKMEPHKIPFLYNFSPTIVPPPLDWPEWIRVTGYWFLDEAGAESADWHPPPDLVEFIDSAHKQNKKVVYIGFGSIVVSDPKSMTRCVVDAVLKAGVHAILSKGWSDRLHAKTAEASEPEEPLPSQIHAIPSIPHDWLFRCIDAACHHGGAGTTGASLRAGIPTVIKPFFGDQYFWADRVEALGVGTGVRKLTVELLTEALITATTDRKQIERAKAVGEAIRAENGVATAIECIYRDLDYARSLVKRNPTDLPGEDTEDATIRDQSTRCPSRSSSDQPTSANSAPSEDWSVISDQEERRSSLGSQSSRSRDNSMNHRRNNLTAAVLAVLPDALTSKPSASRSRTTSTAARL